MYAGRNNLYDATIRRMVKESLQAKSEAFFLEHKKDSDEALLCYLRSCAEELGHTPHMKEIIGGQLLLERFTSWDNAVNSAGLPMPHTPNKPSEFLLIVNEEMEQQRIYREKKAEKKRRAQLLQAERERKAKQTAKKSKKKVADKGTTEDRL